MKRAWFQRIRGGGCQTLVMGEKLICYHLVGCHLFLVDLPCLTQPIQPLQCLELVSWGQLLHEETWAWESVDFGRLLLVRMVCMPSGEPSFFFSCLVSIPHSQGLFIFLTRKAAVVSLHAQDFSGFTYVLLSPHALEFYVDFLTQGVDAIAAVTQYFRV